MPWWVNAIAVGVNGALAIWTLTWPEYYQGKWSSFGVNVFASVLNAFIAIARYKGVQP